MLQSAFPGSGERTRLKVQINIHLHHEVVYLAGGNAESKILVFSMERFHSHGQHTHKFINRRHYLH